MASHGVIESATFASRDGVVRVSVIIPCFNAAHFVNDAVTSVVEQGEEGIEIIVVNDGSSDTDALEEALRPFGASVKLLNEPHRGLPAARNRGIAAADGRYLAFLDADDRWKPGFLARQLAFLEESVADAVYCDADLFGPDASRGGTFMGDFPSRGEVSAVAVMKGECVVVMSSVVALAATVREAGGFHTDLDFCEDLDLWVRMLAGGAVFAYHREPLAQRRMHAGNMSSDGLGMARGTLLVIERHRGSVPMTASDRARIDRRCRRLRASIRIAAAKAAIDTGDAKEARRELIAAVRLRPSWKPLVAAACLWLAPGRTVRYLRSARGRSSIVLAVGGQLFE